jgi:hypothetical protein
MRGAGRRIPLLDKLDRMRRRNAVLDETLFASLVDDAGTFPPESLTIPAAVIRHRSDSAAGDPVHTDPFLCSVADLDNLLAQLRTAEAFEIALIGAGPLDPLEAAARRCASETSVSLVAVEHSLQDADAAGLREALAATPSVGAELSRYVEIPQPAGEDLVQALHDHGVAAKIRCGGVRPELFPSVDVLASTVHLLVAVGAVQGDGRPAPRRAVPR